MSTRYSIGQMNQLGDALEAADFTVDDLTKLRSTPHLATIRNLIRGQVEIAVTKHVIDLDAKPFVPNGWSVEEHNPGGQFTWDLGKVSLFLSQGQEGKNWITGNKLRQELKDRPVFNANLLDYLLANPQIIPEEWKGKYVFFWGTIYRHSDGSLYVRYLGWIGMQWHWDVDWLGDDWSVQDPAVVLVTLFVSLLPGGMRVFC